jgi:hypothetical protein
MTAPQTVKVRLQSQTKTANTGATLVGSVYTQKQFAQAKLPNIWVSVKEQ